MSICKNPYYNPIPIRRKQPRFTRRPTRIERAEREEARYPDMPPEIRGMGVYGGRVYSRAEELKMLRSLYNNPYLQFKPQKLLKMIRDAIKEESDGIRYYDKVQAEAYKQGLHYIAEVISIIKDTEINHFDKLKKIEKWILKYKIYREARKIK